MRRGRERGTLLAGTLLLAACTGAADGGTTPTPMVREPATATPESNTVRVEATEYAFSIPPHVTGGVVTFELANVGGLLHEFAVGYIDGGKTDQDLLAALNSGEDAEAFPWIHDIGGVGVLSPGITLPVTRELTTAGRYFFLCFLPDPTGRPHYQLGMIQGFDVSGDASLPLPAPDATITATEDGFDVPELSPGVQLLELENAGTRPHEFQVVSFEPGKTAKDLNRWFRLGFEGPPPAVFPWGHQSIEPGVSVFQEVELQSGRTYLLADFESGFEEEIVIP